MEEMCQAGKNVRNNPILQIIFFLCWREEGGMNQDMLTGGLGMGGVACGMAEMNKN
jgi:hypothetical protein